MLLHAVLSSEPKPRKEPQHASPNSIKPESNREHEEAAHSANAAGARIGRAAAQKCDDRRSTHDEEHQEASAAAASELAHGADARGRLRQRRAHVRRGLMSDRYINRKYTPKSDV